MSNATFISQIIEFVNELIKSLASGTLFFGSFGDFIRYTIDIGLVTALIYSILLFIRHSRYQVRIRINGRSLKGLPWDWTLMMPIK